MRKTKAEDRTVVLYIVLPGNGDLRLGNNMYRKIDNRSILYRSLENACNHLILSICHISGSSIRNWVIPNINNSIERELHSKQTHCLNTILTVMNT